jgi:hypothetical protein
VPEEAWKEGIEDKAASFIFMPDKFGIVCADMSMLRSVFWAKDEMARSAITGNDNPAVRMHHSRAESFFFAQRRKYV